MIYYFEDVKKVYELAFSALVYHAQTVHQSMQVADAAYCGDLSDVAICSGTDCDSRLNSLVEFANLDAQPKALMIEVWEGADVFEYVRLVAIARLLLHKTLICVPSGKFGDEGIALCLCAGGNALASGEEASLAKFGLRSLSMEEHSRKMRGCKGDGSCGREGCKGDGSCGNHDHHHHH